MSSYHAPAIHPETGKTEMARFLDDYFGKHRYGVQFSDGKIFPERVVQFPDEHRLFFEDTIKKSGNADYRAITRKDMANAVDDRKSTPFLANNFLKAMRGLFSWAAKNDHTSVDPTVGVEGVKAKSDGFPAWTVEDVAKFCARST